MHGGIIWTNDALMNWCTYALLGLNNLTLPRMQRSNSINHTILGSDTMGVASKTLQWRHNDRDGVSNHRRLDCFLNRFFHVQIKENMKAPRHWPLWGEFSGYRWMMSLCVDIRYSWCHICQAAWHHLNGRVRALIRTCSCTHTYMLLTGHGARLLTWFNFNLSMDK